MQTFIETKGKLDGGGFHNVLHQFNFIPINSVQQMLIKRIKSLGVVLFNVFQWNRYFSKWCTIDVYESFWKIIKVSLFSSPNRIENIPFFLFFATNNLAINWSGCLITWSSWTLQVFWNAASKLFEETWRFPASSVLFPQEFILIFSILRSSQIPQIREYFD